MAGNHLPEKIIGIKTHFYVYRYQQVLSLPAF